MLTNANNDNFPVVCLSRIQFCRRAEAERLLSTVFIDYSMIIRLMCSHCMRRDLFPRCYTLRDLWPSLPGHLRINVHFEEQIMGPLLQENRFPP